MSDHKAQHARDESADISVITEVKGPQNLTIGNPFQGISEAINFQDLRKGWGVAR